MQRLVAYIYEYKKISDNNETDGEEKYVKCCNAGFCRVEIREEYTRINIFFKNIYRQSCVCEIYGVNADKCRNKEFKYYKKEKFIVEKNIVNGEMKACLSTTNNEGLLIKTPVGTYFVTWIGAIDKICLKLRDSELQKNTEYRDEKCQCELNENSEKAEDEEKSNSRENEIVPIRKSKNSCDNIAMLERVYNRMCKVRVTFEEKTYQVVLLKPHEFIMFPRKYWHLANNPFIMESYYFYGVILFFKYNGEYVLGVKGGNGVKEKARQCSFQYSVEGIDSKNKSKESYWIMELK